MKTSLKIDGLMIASVAALAVGAYLVTRPSNTFNPASRENIAYGGVNKIGSELSGDSSWTLGGWIYDITHEEYKP